MLIDELTKHLITMKVEHSYKEVPETEDLSDTPSNDCAQDMPNNSIDIAFNKEAKPALFQRRKGPLSNTNEDELKVVIERDNMLVGFLDAIDSASDDSANEEEAARRKCLKRARSRSPNTSTKVGHIYLQFSLYWLALKFILFCRSRT